MGYCKLSVFVIGILVSLLCNSALIAAAPPVASVFESSLWAIPANAVDAKVEAVLKKHGAQLRKPCSDEVFIRRAYLDLIGTLPTPNEITPFLQSKSSSKRAEMIDTLFARDEFADYWSMKWCDILRVKSEFPINLWPNAVQAYHRWIHDAIRENRPYDKFARQLLTSSGSNFLEPPANFYRAVQGRDSASIAKAVALTFMGVRFERLPKTSQSNMGAFFSRVGYKKTDEWKEEIVYLNPAITGSMNAVFPDGAAVVIPAGADPREVFTNWLVAPTNKWFARNIVNRIWYWTMGRGIIDEPDDIRSDNPPASAELLACLEKELIDSHYDLRSIYRLILNSRTYQQSSVPCGDTSDPKIQFAHYTVRRLDAEVLIDALCWIGGDGAGYTSATPEPYSFIPKEQRTIALADGSITSPFLATFGRPSRDTGLESERNNKPTDSQCLYLLNSTDIQQKIEKSPQLTRTINANKKNIPAMTRDIYVLILSRHPSPEELTATEQYFKSKGLFPAQAGNELAWALINSKEFLYRH
ncbi:MAG: DUF1553 domain-containing protein [Armatimonadetes bacterium]|nr:DUF1553 domain-containing protein [Armatimonadota bacterium]